MTAMFGRVQEFDSKQEVWEQYVERLGNFFAANKVTEGMTERDVFLAVIEAKNYKLLSDLLSPAKPGEKPYTELVDTLNKHFSPNKAF